MLSCWCAGNHKKYCYISNTSPFPAAAAEVGTDLQSPVEVFEGNPIQTGEVSPEEPPASPLVSLIKLNGNLQGNRLNSLRVILTSRP